MRMYILIRESIPIGYAMVSAAHASLAVTRGLLDALDREELEGVLGHEMSHIYNRDTLLMGVAAVLVGGVAMFSHAIMRVLWWGGGGGGRRSKIGRAHV